MTIRDKISSRAFVGLVVGLVVTGCTTSTNFVDYQQQGLYSSSDSVGGMDYVEIGPVTGRASGYIWQSCEELQQEALAELQAEVQKHSANRVFDVRWVNHSRGSRDEAPVCTTRWGWFAGLGVAGLGPWMKATEVRGKLAFVDSARAEKLRASAQDYASQAKEERGAQHSMADKASKAGEDAQAQDSGGEAPATADSKPAASDSPASEPAESGPGGSSDAAEPTGSDETDSAESTENGAAEAMEASEEGSDAAAES